MQAYVNGTFLPKAEAVVSIEDRGYQFADGIYEVILLQNGKLAFLDAHLDRLWRSAKGLDLTLPFERQELKDIMAQLIALDGQTEGSLYMQVTRGTAPRDHKFPDGAKPTVVIYLKPPAAASDAKTKGAGVITLEDNRWLECWIKSVSLLPNVLARELAVRRGAREALLVRDGIALECSSSNFFIVRAGEILTHPASRLILAGITRGVAIDVARSGGLTVVERPMTVAEVFTADEAFYTSTTAFITPIVSVDGRPIGAGARGPITTKVQTLFHEALIRDVGESTQELASNG